MARMLPSRFPPDVPSNAERRVFGALERDLPATWTCLHSLPIANHPRKDRAELDFVLIGPPGVFCLEVKGGRLIRRDRTWFSRDGRGVEHPLPESPWEQVDGAHRALRQFVKDARPGKTEPLFGYGVVLPDVRFTRHLPDVDPATLLDRTIRTTGMGPFVEGLATFWERRVREAGRRTRPLSDAERAALVDLLGGDLDLTPSLATHMGYAGDEQFRLTREQKEFFDRIATVNPRVLVEGGAGTGKTVIAVAEAGRAAAEGARVLYLCFNKLLAARRRPTAPNGVEVIHLHSLIEREIRAAGLAAAMPTSRDQRFWDVDAPRLALDALTRSTAPAPYDLIVMDEGQDIMSDAYLDVIDALLVGGLEDGRWRIFYDPKQNLFGRANPEALERLRACRPTEFPLTVNCRNTREIAREATHLSGIDVPESLTDGPAVREHRYRTAAEARRLVTNAVAQLLSPGEVPAAEIVVLAHHTLPHTCLAGGWARDIGVGLQPIQADADLPPATVGFSTIGAFKGLEADAIVLLETGGDDEAVRRHTYVGASRARTHLTAIVPATLQLTLRPHETIPPQ